MNISLAETYPTLRIEFCCSSQKPFFYDKGAFDAITSKVALTNAAAVNVMRALRVIEPASILKKGAGGVDDGELEKESSISFANATARFVGGKRSKQADSHQVGERTLEIGDRTNSISFVGVFDGFRSDVLAKKASEELIDEVLLQVKRYNRDKLSITGVWQAIKIAFSTFSFTSKAFDFGTTASLSFIIGNVLFNASCGNSSSMVIKKGKDDAFLIPSSESYIPSALRRGALIEKEANSSHSVTRYYHDNHSIKYCFFKSLGHLASGGAVNPRPDIYVEKVDALAALVSATDGLWNETSPAQVVLAYRINYPHVEVEQLLAALSPIKPRGERGDHTTVILWDFLAV